MAADAQQADRTSEVQRGKGGVDAEGSSQLLATLSADTIPCVRRGGAGSAHDLAAQAHE